MLNTSHARNCFWFGAFSNGYRARCCFCGSGCDKDIQYTTPPKHSVQFLWVDLVRLIMVLKLDESILLEVQMGDLRSEVKILDDFLLKVGAVAV